jgi:hypothetical protein
MCPNGERISRAEKLVALVLADSHQDKASTRTFPAMKMIAADSLMDPRVCRRIMASLERKGVIEREREANQGRGQITFYRFPALDEKGDMVSSFFQGKRRTEGGRKEDKTAIPPIEEQEQEPKQKLHPLPPQAGGGCAAPSPIDAKAYEAAVDQVMHACGFTAKRMRVTIRDVLRQEVVESDQALPLALAAAIVAMAEAWEDYTSQGVRLRFKWGARRFFAEGYWRNRESWPWDNEVFKLERICAEARVGSR